MSIEDVIRELETSSSAEVVVEVRTRSGAYAEAAARFAALVAFITLLFILFCPWTVEPWIVPSAVAVGYLVGLYVSLYVAQASRWMTTKAERNNKVRNAAAAAFVERGVANTERETGMLVYLSLLERRIEIVADRGVLNAVPVIEWNQLMESARARDATLATVTDFLHALQPVLAKYLPARADDRNELPNEVRFS